MHEAGRQAPPHTMVLFGATGDLAKRKLFPAIFSMYDTGLMPEHFTVVCTGRSPYDTVSFREVVKQSISSFGRLPIRDDAQWADFAEHIVYSRLDVKSDEDFARLHQVVQDIEHRVSDPANRLFYMAMAPEYFGVIALRLRDSGLTKTEGWRRLIIEKPFGHDYASAQELNDELCDVFKEEEIYRIDHYLGKEMVQNIEVIRFANSIFETVWNNRSIASVQITSSETVGVEERAAYYEESGALRDMVQNHILQMVMMIAMEPPSRLKTEAIRDEKVKVLRSLRRFAPEEVADHVVRAQYSAGGGHAGYLEEPGVASDSNTETFIAARLHVDNFRWAGVPFYIRTGKRMGLKSTEIVIQFKDMPKHLYFNQHGNLGPNLLVIRVNPVEGMYIQLNAKRPGSESAVIPVAMEFSQHADNSPEAYERLLFDSMRGDSTFFTRWDEVSLAWKFVDPIAEAFTSNQLPLHQYPCGSLGPDASDALLATDQFQWWPLYGQETPSVEARLEREFGRPSEVRGS